MYYYVTPIFAPNKAKLEENINSITSFSTYINHYNYDVSIIIGGWAINDIYWNEIESLVKKSFKNNIIFRFDKNYGKAYVINYLISNYLNKYNPSYFLTADSDILFPIETEYLFDRLHEIPKQSEKHFNKPFGVVALNQLQQNCHLKHLIYANKFEYINKYNNKEEMVYPTKPGGIAGGSLFTSLEAWNRIGGYRILNVYGGNDAYYLIDINLKGYTYQMSDSIAIIHPFGTDKKYAEWKVDMNRNHLSRTILTFEELKERTKIADNFWKNK